MKRILTHIMAAFLAFNVGVLAETVVGSSVGYMSKGVDIPSQRLDDPLSVPPAYVEEHGFIMVQDKKTGMRHCIRF
jgi:hypothetical protein